MQNSPPAERPLAYSVNEAAEALRCSRQFIHKLITNGQLSAVKLGRKTLIRAEEIDRLLAEGTE